MLIFQAPPNWPPAPVGWAPPPGWQPDPTWPEVPPGWQLWTDSERPVQMSFRGGCRFNTHTGLQNPYVVLEIAGRTVTLRIKSRFARMSTLNPEETVFGPEDTTIRLNKALYHGVRLTKGSNPFNNWIFRTRRDNAVAITSYLATIGYGQTQRREWHRTKHRVNAA